MTWNKPAVKPDSIADDICVARSPGAHGVYKCHGPPQIMLLAINFDDYFIDIESITLALVLSFQVAGIHSCELDAPVYATALPG